MRIVIIGLSSSGKTTLAKTISSAFHFPSLHLDEIIFKFHGNKKRTRVASRTYIPQIRRFVKQKDWVIEGMFPFEFLFKEADYVVWMKPSILRLLWRQWKRYVLDQEQRERYGFISNLKLCRFNIEVRMNRQGITTEDTKPRIYMHEMEELLYKKFKDKLIIVEDRSQIELFLHKLTRRLVRRKKKV